MTTRDNRSLALLVRDKLLKLIQDGDYVPGDQLPSERQLAEQFAVSRPTIREALRILEEEGRIDRRIGLGTFVSDLPVVEAGLETLSSFTEMMAAVGHEAGTSHLHVEEGEITVEEAELFQVEPGTPKVTVERVRTIDGKPVMFSIHVFPKKLIGDVPHEWYLASIFALLEEQSGVRMSHAHTRIYSALAGEEIGQKLGCSPDSPLLVLDELMFNTDNQVMSSGLSHFRGDFHRYHIVRRRPSIS